MLLNLGVPLFLFTQAFITLSKLYHAEHTVMSYYSLTSFKKLFFRIFLPWIILVVAECCFGHKVRIRNIVVGFAAGPGSYYLAVYCLIYVLLPIVFEATKKMKTLPILVLAILFSLMLDYTGNLLLPNTPYPAAIYRVIGYRYFFIIPLTVIIVRYYYGEYEHKQKILFWTLFITFGLIALGFFIEFYYFGIKQHFIPFPQSYGWDSHRWLYFMYPALVFSIFLDFSKNSKFFGSNKTLFARFLVWAGNYSWYLFLVQMFWFSQFKYGFFFEEPKDTNNISTTIINVLIYSIMSYAVIFFVVFCIDKLKKSVVSDILRTFISD